VTVGWIVLFVGVTAAMVIVAVRSWHYSIDMMELGTVSEQWLAEHRAHDRQSSSQR
jgi:hypothetical protein